MLQIQQYNNQVGLEYNHLMIPNTLAHQGGYLFPLLNYFSNSDLSQLNSTQDKVYFNAPFFIAKYPFSWIIPMVLVGIFLFGLFVFLGIGKKIFLLTMI